MKPVSEANFNDTIAHMQRAIDDKNLWINDKLQVKTKANGFLRFVAVVLRAFGIDLFAHVRTNKVANEIFKFAMVNKDHLTADNAKQLFNTLEWLKLRTGKKYTMTVAKTEAAINGLLNEKGIAAINSKEAPQPSQQGTIPTPPPFPPINPLNGADGEPNRGALFASIRNANPTGSLKKVDLNTPPNRKPPVPPLKPANLSSGDKLPEIDAALEVDEKDSAPARSPVVKTAPNPGNIATLALAQRARLVPVKKPAEMPPEAGDTSAEKPPILRKIDSKKGTHNVTSAAVNDSAGDLRSVLRRTQTEIPDASFTEEMNALNLDTIEGEGKPDSNDSLPQELADAVTKFGEEFAASVEQ